MSDIEKRLADMERQLHSLEERTRSLLWGSASVEAKVEAKEGELLKRYGEHVDKTQAAKILGVTRATVYAMLSDGRIEGAYSGRRVSVRSIARYIAAPKSSGSRIGCRNRRKEEQDGADTLEEA